MHRVVVTGYGVISPVGLNAIETWDALLAGKSGIGPLTLFQVDDFPVKYVGEIKNFDPTTVLDPKEVRRQDRVQWIAQAAAKEAIEHSCLEITDANRQRIGVIVSSAIGGLDSIEDQVNTVYNEGARRVSPFCIPRIMSNGSAGLLSIAYGLCGPTFSVASACASGADGIGVAFNFLRSGLADVIVAGGAEAGITRMGLASFHRIGAYSQRSDGTPSPFSADRDGLIMGEGAAVLVLESLEHAKARRADIYGEVVGYGSSADAFHITAPTEDGSGSAAAIQAALADARLNPDDIDYINAHGTGTPLNDASETLAIKRAMGNRAYGVPISSIKSMTGHLMGATGALEAVFCIQAINSGMIPPTINYSGPDEVCDLDYVPNQARECEVHVALSNSFGFGGHNSVLAFKKYSG